MKSIYQWVGVLCISSYIMGLLLNLVHLTYTQKVVRLVVAMFIIITLFAPLKQEGFWQEEILYPDDAYQNTITINAVETIVVQAAENIANTVKSRLDKENICYETVNVHINEQDGSLYIQNVEIVGCDVQQQSKITGLLADITDKERIIFGG